MAKSPAPDLTGKVALVTGATRGIGREIALALAKAGAHVVAAGRTEGGLTSLDDEIRAAGCEPASLVTLDLTDGDGIDRLGAALFERWGRLDILVGSAGILGVVTPVAHMDVAFWDRVIAVNLTANFRLLRSMDPLLRRAPAARVVFMTSGMASRRRPFFGAYAASKAGLEALCATYAEEVDNTPIRVAMVNPGPMRTRMRSQAFPGEDPKDLPPPAEIAPMILELVDASRQPPPGVVHFRQWKTERAPAA